MRCYNKLVRLNKKKNHLSLVFLWGLTDWVNKDAPPYICPRAGHLVYGRYETQHNETQHNNIQHYDKGLFVTLSI